MKKNKNVSRNKNISILIVISVFILYMPNPAAAYERPEVKDGLTGLWHPGALCISCHYSLSTTEKAQSISAGCKCHNKIYAAEDAKSVYKVNSSKIVILHEDIICVRCHIGNKNRPINAQDMHATMKGLACSVCHVVSNGTYNVPEKNKCFECHGGDPHVVHGSKTEKLCVACHGEFGERYLANTLVAQEKEMIPVILAKNETVVTKEYPTIIDYIMGMLKSI